MHGACQRIAVRLKLRPPIPPPIWLGSSESLPTPFILVLFASGWSVANLDSPLHAENREFADPICRTAVGTKSRKKLQTRG
jgi:hypothetical protein